MNKFNELFFLILIYNTNNANITLKKEKILN